MTDIDTPQVSTAAAELDQRGGGLGEAPLVDPDLPAASSGPIPQRGDTLTLYAIPAAAPWLGIACDTLRGLIRDGLIPRRFLSKPTPGKTMLSADAIHALADWFREVDWVALRNAPPAGIRAHRSRSGGHHR